MDFVLNIPVNKNSCQLFYVLSLLNLVLSVLTLVVTIITIFASLNSKGIVTSKSVVYAILSCGSSFLAYYINQVLYTICIKVL